MIGKKQLIIFITLSSITTAAHLVFADEMPGEKKWEFNLSPLYLWATKVEGDVTLGPKSNSTEVEFNDIFDNVEGAFTLNFSGLHKSNFGFLFDFIYLDINADKGASSGNNLSVGLKEMVSQFAGTYRFGSSDHAFDTVAGIRYLSVELEVEAKGTPMSESEKTDLVDPIIGGRYIWKIADQWNLKLYGDIGGFGVGSDFTWQALGVIDFWPWENVGFSVGYRGLEYRFDDDTGTKKFDVDLLLHGPIVGISFRW